MRFFKAFPVGLHKLPAMVVVPTTAFAGMADEAEQAITTAISSWQEELEDLIHILWKFHHFISTHSYCIFS